MKLSMAQTIPVKGDIAANILNHKKLIALAAANGAEVIIFPELSLTGYEPALATTLATQADDGRFDDLQQLANSHNITIGAGVPTTYGPGICISMILFQPNQPRQTYSKKYLHADEKPFFISGPNFPILQVGQTKIGLAICYELSIPEHAAVAHEHGADLYLASVAKSATGVAAASQRLADIAQSYGIPALLCNCVGPSDDFESVGETAVWDSNGNLISQLNKTDEGLLIFDSDSQEAWAITP